MEQVHLSTRMMKSIIQRKNQRYCDAEIRCLQVWVGKKKISFLMRKQKERHVFFVKLGNWPEITVKQAREKALDYLTVLGNHKSFVASSLSRNPLVRDAVECYIAHQDSERKKKDAFTAILPFQHLFNKRVCDISSMDIETVHKTLNNTPAKANQSVKRFVAALHYICKKKGLPYTSPLTDFPWYPLYPRDRYITREEAPRFFDVLEQLRNNSRDAMLVDMIYMMLYTGARKTNVCEMMLEEINRDGLWTIPPSKFKTKREHSIQLGETELGIVEKYRNGRTKGPVFPHERSLFARVRRVLKKTCALARMENFHLHDLRRTLGTWMLSHGIPIAIVSKKLGHSSIRITEQVYAHLMPDVSKDATAEAIDAMRQQK